MSDTARAETACDTIRCFKENAYIKIPRNMHTAAKAKNNPNTMCETMRTEYAIATEAPKTIC